ncbi:MAG TPA: GGDEF domain-containing protein [Gaiellaceae bacterium]|nr:GGDEF domain-containing protein [Gaiellaceae bacterium]
MDAALSHRDLLASAALLAYAGITAAYVAFEVPGLGIGHFYYLPIALLALGTGGRVGAAGGVLATALYVAGVLLNSKVPSADVLTVSTAIRAVTYVSSGALIGVFASRNRALVERLRELADRDFLTGLLNARSLEAALHRRCEGARRFTLLLADVDGLKETNDTRGHAAGDALLRAAGAGLEAALREGDEVGRIGGDEFGVVTDVVTAEDAEALARRIERELARREVEISVGWALFPVDGGTAVALSRRADERLYASKSVRKARAQVTTLLRPTA